jgi:hypothetical protein
MCQKRCRESKRGLERVMSSVTVKLKRLSGGRGLFGNSKNVRMINEDEIGKPQANEKARELRKVWKVIIKTKIHPDNIDRSAMVIRTSPEMPLSDLLSPLGYEIRPRITSSESNIMALAEESNPT